MPTDAEAVLVTGVYWAGTSSAVADTAHGFFPQVISAPFHNGVSVVFTAPQP
jgi:hypothetical protein